MNTRERIIVGIAVAIGLLNVLVALFGLPYSPGFDERTLYTSIYAFQHYGRLIYPFYDLPFMVNHPPTKYWFVGMLVTSGVPLRLATGGLFVAVYAIAVGGVFAANLRLFWSLALVFTLTATITLCPFIAYSPENPSLAEIIGRIRPDDIVFVFWFAGLLWLEAGRRHGWRPSYAFAGSLCITMAMVSHYSGIPAVFAIAVYAAAACWEQRRLSAERLWPLVLGAVVILVPFALGVGSSFPRMFSMVFNQAGDGASAFSYGWRRHQADLWFLLVWMKRHAGNVWPLIAVLAGPVKLGVPPVLIAGAVLLAFRSLRVLTIAALPLPLAVLLVGHKWIGYELPEIALAMLACGAIAATMLERIMRPGLRTAAAGVCLLPLLTASPLAWDRSALRFMDQAHSPELLRAMGRAVVGPGATVTGSYYTGGEDNFILWGTLKDPGVDFVAERDFDTYGAALQDLYLSGKAHLAGFVLTPEMPSASVVYFTSRTEGARPLSGFVTRNGAVQKFSPGGHGWAFEVLSCRAFPEELPWASPGTPIPIAAYVARTDHCVNRTRSARGLDGRFASLFMRRSYGDGKMDPAALVLSLIDDDAAAQSAAAVREQCGCRVVESVAGGLTGVSADALVSDLKNSDEVIQFYATPADFLASRSMMLRFYGDAASRPIR